MGEPASATVIHEGVPLFVARPASPNGGALVLLQEAFGVNHHIQDVARRFAAEGYVVVAPHLFHRQPTQVFAYGDLPAAKAAIGEVQGSELLHDVRAAVAWLGSPDGAPGSPVATIGFCFGGRASFLAATAVPELFAAVCFYGAGIAPDGVAGAPVSGASGIRCPVLALYGGRDVMIPADEVARVEAALTEADVPHQVHVYADADHGFFCDARPAVYDEASARDAWPRTLTFLADARAAAGSS
jgi:dienelactone hydrolase